MSERFVMAFDVEGPILNPGLDFAWLIIQNLIKTSNLKRLQEKVKVFDEYDDNRWLHERAIGGHSTGTTPIISSLLAIAYGAKNNLFLDLARKYLKFTPGAAELIRWLKDEKGIRVYLISSAHPAAILPVAYKLGIPSSRVFCDGHQLTQKKAEEFDRKRNAKRSGTDQVMLAEVKERFPYDQHSGSKNLGNFLESYLEFCSEMNNLYKTSEVDKRILESMKGKQELFLAQVEGEDERLAEDLWYLLYSEFGVMGAHRKEAALMSIERREHMMKENLFYIGDSIVDADPLAYAGHGISVNCTNKEALLSSRINLSSPTLKSLVPLIEFIGSRQTLTAKSKETLEKEMNKEISAGTKGVPPARLFTAGEITNDLSAVTQSNRLCKDYIKNLQSQGKQPP